MADRLQNIKAICSGGQVENLDVITTGLSQQLSGTASLLVNYEPALEGGYQKILGYTEYDTNVVPGLSSSLILGCKVAHDGVYAARMDSGSTGVDIYYGAGSGWGSPINAAGLNTSTSKVRFITFSISQEVVVATNGYDYARHYDSSQTETVINGTGAPTAPKYAEMVNARLILAPASNASSIAISSPSDETDFDGVNGAIEINVGDIVTGLRRFRDTLYVFCRNSIWKLVGSTSADFALVAVTRSIGCLSHDSIQELAGDLVFLAPDGLRSVAATTRIGDLELGLLSQVIQPTIRDIISSLTEDDITSCLIRGKSQYRMFIYDSGDDNDTDAVGILGKSNREAPIEWAKLSGFRCYCADSQYLSNGTELVVHGHVSDGKIYQQESGNSFNGADIPFVYKTPAFMFGDAVFRKILQKVTLYTQVSGSFTTNLTVLLDYRDGNKLQPSIIPITHSGGQATYGNAIYGTNTYSSVQIQVIKKNLSGSCYEASFNFSGSDTNPPHRIDAIEIQYLVKGQK